MGVPRYKIFTADNEYVASVRYLEDAACLIGALYHGGTVRDGHAKRETLWTEGAEQFSASESYDGAANIMRERRDAMIEKRRAKWKERQKSMHEEFAARAKPKVFLKAAPLGHRNTLIDGDE